MKFLLDFYNIPINIFIIFLWDYYGIPGGILWDSYGYFFVICRTRRQPSSIYQALTIIEPHCEHFCLGEISPRILWNLKETNAIQSFWNSFPYNSPNYWPIWNIKRCARKALSRLSRLFIGFQVLSKICSFALLFPFLNAGTWSSGTKLFLDHVCSSPSAASISSPHMGDLPCTSAAISRFGTSRNICRIL